MSETITQNGDDRKEPPSSLFNLAECIRRWLHRKSDEETMREKIEELIDAPPAQEETPQAHSERQMIANILRARDRQVRDLMVPRADIVAVPTDISLTDLLAVIEQEGHSRLPVYREEMDEIVGMIHVKDLLPFVMRPQEFSLQAILRNVLIVAPSMPALDLLLEMRQSRRHMAMVVDEFGGIDGLITIEDMVEEIVGDIEDEHDETVPPPLVVRADGTVMADGRLELEELEQHTGPLLDTDEHDSVDTLGGLLFFLTGHVPSRGELVRHESGIEFEVVDADARRVRRVRIRNIPKRDKTE